MYIWRIAIRKSRKKIDDRKVLLKLLNVSHALANTKEVRIYRSNIAKTYIKAFYLTSVGTPYLFRYTYLFRYKRLSKTLIASDLVLFFSDLSRQKLCHTIHRKLSFKMASNSMEELQKSTTDDTHCKFTGFLFIFSI